MAVLPTPTRGEVISGDFRIKPNEVLPTRVGSTIFGNDETVAAARQLIVWAQAQGAWRPFTHGEVSAFFANKKKKDEFGFFFGALLRPRRDVKGDTMIPFGGGWIVEQDGKFHFTTGFVEACHAAGLDKLAKRPCKVVEQ